MAATEGSPSFHPSFSSQTADVILRSSDNVDFRVHKLILSETSSVFECMFSLPAPQPSFEGLSGDDHRDGLPVVRVAEDSETLGGLLGICYPGKGPTLADDVSAIGQILAVADKYAMVGVYKQLESVLSRRDLVESDPLRTYALACRFGFRTLAVMSAKASLTHPFPGPPLPEFVYMSGRDFYDLVSYRQRCFEVIEGVTASERADDFRLSHVWATLCGMSRRMAGNYASFSGCQKCDKAWFKLQMESVRKALRAKPCGSAITSPQFLQEMTWLVQQQCPTCSLNSGTLTGQLLEFHWRLAALVDAEVAKVCEVLSTSLLLARHADKGSQVPFETGTQ